LTALQASALSLSAKDLSLSDKEKFMLLDIPQSLVEYREYTAFLVTQKIIKKEY
jgi:hypothetical protein